MALQSLRSLGITDYEIIPTLLMQLISPSDSIRESAAEILEEIGVENPENKLLHEKILKIVKKVY